MSSWKIIKPLAATNYVLNPSAETTGNYTQDAGATVDRSTTYAAWGAYSYKITPGAADKNIKLTTLTTPAGKSRVQFAAKVTAGTLQASGNGTDYVTCTEIGTLGRGWKLYGVNHATYFAAITTLWIRNSVNEVWYLDGVMLTPGIEVLHTYIDGTQAGCSWRDVPHGSSSTRDVRSRAGGQILDLDTDLYATVKGLSGPLTVTLQTSARPFRPGGSVDAVKIPPKLFLLQLLIVGAGFTSMNQRVVGILDVLKPDGAPLATDGRPQPVRIQYWGTYRMLELGAHFEAGLDGAREPEQDYLLEAPIVLRAANPPAWYEVIETVTAVSTQETATVRGVIARVNEEWTDCGPPATYDDTAVLTFCQGPNDRYVYAGGEFTNLDGYAYIAVYDKAADAWEKGADPAADGAVRALVYGPDGTIYAGGDFDNIGVAANCNYVAALKAGVWETMSTGLAYPVQALALALDGTLYAAIYNAAGPAAYVYKWDGSTWSQVGTGSFDGAVYALALAPPYNTGFQMLFAGGGFTERVSYYNGGSADWQQHPAGVPGTGAIYALAVTNSKLLFAGGQITGGVVMSRLLMPQWDQLEDGVDASVYALALDERNGHLYVGTSGGRGGIYDKVLRWSLSGGWLPVPVTIPYTSSERVTGLYVGPAPDAGIGPILPWLPPSAQGLPDLFIGMNVSGTATWTAATQIITTAIPGGAETRPVIRFSRSGTDAATINSVINRTTGQEIVLNAEIADGEALVIDLARMRLYSEYYGIWSRSLTPEPGSQVAGWSLLPTGNTIEVRVNTDGAGVTAQLQYRQQYHGYEAADVVQ